MSDEKSYGQCKCPDCGMITSSSIRDKCFCDRDSIISLAASTSFSVKEAMKCLNKAGKLLRKGNLDI